MHCVLSEVDDEPAEVRPLGRDGFCTLADLVLCFRGGPAGPFVVDVTAASAYVFFCVGAQVLSGFGLEKANAW